MDRWAGSGSAVVFGIGMAAAVLVAGCGGSSSKSTSTPPGSTTIVLQASSDANARFVGFGMSVDSLSLTNKAGVTTTVYSTPTYVDFLAWNANAAPLAEFSVPRDEYISAAVNASKPWFTFLFMGDGGDITTSTDAYGYLPTPPTVTLPEPITVSGSTMGLTLNLQAAQSGSYSGTAAGSAYIIHPAFTLSSFALPGGAAARMLGQVNAMGSGSMTLQIPAGTPFRDRTLTASLNASTVYQGIASASDLAVGMVLNVDTAVQSDGTYAATRVEVPDAAAPDAVVGQVMEWVPDSSMILSEVSQQVGTHLFPSPVGTGTDFQYSGTTKFQTSADFGSPAGLPFTPMFDSTSMAAGQMVEIGASSISYNGGSRSQASTMTLAPQFIDATVVGQTTSGRFNVYSVQLAPYDLIVQMNSAVTPLVNKIVPHAQLVTVYVDSSVGQSPVVAPGIVYRFHGWLFNDAGTLRLVSDKVMSGVAQ